MHRNICIFLWLLAASLEALIGDARIATNDSFYCIKEKKVISKSKVCNFVNDCSDGSDESKCGQCDFSGTAESCGLELKGDKAFGWFINKVPVLIHLGQRVSPQHYLIAEVLPTLRQYNSRMHLHPEVLYKPKILFPVLKATDNQRCRLSLRLHVSNYAPLLDFTPEPHPTHPNMHVITKLYRYDVLKKRQVRDYHVTDLKVKYRGQWETVEVDLPQSYTGYSWSLEIVSVMRIDSYPVHFGDFKFLDCNPSKDSYTPPPEIHAIGGADRPCGSGMFKCKISGLCIDESLVCDFGYDCDDENDTSDEQLCTKYPGRCNFENSDLCSWYPLPSAVDWSQMSAHQDDQKFYGDKPRPPVDHTFRSAQLGGRYILLDTELMNISELFRLTGPRVELQDGAQHCSMRLWIHTPESVSRKGFQNTHLQVDVQRIPPQKLLDWTNSADSEPPHSLLPEEPAHADNKNWRRFEVRLLDRDIPAHKMIYALQVSFGNLHEELKQFNLNKGYLALDDFSFSVGCKLTFHGNPTDNTCDENQFYCFMPTPVTGVSCIPNKYYCDFKNDCSALATQGTAVHSTDELNCPSECNFQHGSDRIEHCNYHIIDTNKMRLEDEISLSQGHIIGEPFSWSLYMRDGYLEMKFEPSGLYLLESSSNPENLEGQKIYTVSSMDMRLPTFSESHANCSFELVYQWDKTTHGISSSIALEHDLGQHLLKELVPHGDGWKMVRVGVGQQSSEFRLVVRIRIHEGIKTDNSTYGRLMIRSYRFVDCSFTKGIIDPSAQATFELPEDDDDDVDYIGNKDYLEYPLASYSDKGRIDRTCRSDYMQCYEPILCIPLNMRCDLQRDCQNGRDEEPELCSEFTWITFDEPDEVWMSGWQNDGSWMLMSSGERPDLRQNYDTGPPSDHTSSRSTSKYLATGSSLNEHAGAESLFSSPEMVLEADCRLVYYVYLWGGSTKSLGVYLVPSEGQPRSNWQLLHQVEEKLDAWQRVEISLGSFSLDKQGQKFVLVFVGSRRVSSSLDDLIALDDVSFSTSCRLNNSSSLSLKELERLDGDRALSSWLLAILFLVAFVLASFSLVQSGLAARASDWARRMTSDRQFAYANQNENSAGPTYAYVLEELNLVLEENSSRKQALDEQAVSS